jgi:hypothetical protein
MTDRSLFSVEESPASIAEQIETAHTARIANALQPGAATGK